MRTTNIKLIFYLFAALLAIATIALPQDEFTSECIESALPPGVICKDGHFTILNDLAYDDVDETYDLNTAYGRYASSNLTFATSAVRDVTQKYEYKAEIYMDGEKQHVGTLHKQRLYDVIFDCLGYLCPLSQPGCVPDHNRYSFFGYYTKCRIDSIVYLDHKKNRLATNAHLEVFIRSYYFDPDSNHADLKRSMFELVAGTYAVMTERYENCYEVDTIGRRVTTFCNISPHVLVAFPANTRKDVPYVAVTVTFSGKTPDHVLDCEASRGPVTDFFDRASREDFAAAYGVQYPEVTSSVACKMDPGCYREVTRELCYPWTHGSRNRPIGQPR